MQKQENSSFTFLTNEQIFGSNQLDILRKYGTKCAITDFSILLGGEVSNFSYSSEGESLAHRTGWWWTKSPEFVDDVRDAVRVVLDDGDKTLFRTVWRFGGARPALPYSEISSISSNKVRGNDGILEVEYGEYPQDIVNILLTSTLEAAYSNRILTKTGKSYTTDSVNFNDYNTPFKVRNHIEYEYKGHKYIRIIADSNCSGKKLSDGRIIENGKAYWVEVKPIKWMIDERANIALSKKIIFAGIQFNNETKYAGDFDRTDIKSFMDNDFSKDIIPKEVSEREKQIPNEPIEKIIDRILDNPREFYIKIAGELSIAEREYIKKAIKNKSCTNCSNGTCRVETYEKHNDDTCVAWDNKELIGRQKILRHNNLPKDKTLL